MLGMGGWRLGDRWKDINWLTPKVDSGFKTHVGVRSKITYMSSQILVTSSLSCCWILGTRY